MDVYTIGHSSRTLDLFAELLAGSSIDVVVDVRRLPGSRRFPQFDQDALDPQLAVRGIEYVWARELTGRRGRDEDVPADVNGFWRNQSFHNYADHALSSTFQAAVGELDALSSGRRCAVMCSEALWWRCHRRIIADYLVARGRTVLHILGPKRFEEARLSEGAAPQEDGVIFYPGPAPGTKAEN